MDCLGVVGRLSLLARLSLSLSLSLSLINGFANRSHRCGTGIGHAEGGKHGGATRDLWMVHARIGGPEARVSKSSRILVVLLLDHAPRGYHTQLWLSRYEYLSTGIGNISLTAP